MADSELSILLKMVDEISGPMGKVGKKLNKIGKLATKVGKSMTRNLTLPILGLAAASVKSFADFEEGMASVSTLIDTTTESMEDMNKAVLALGKKTPVALSELTGALFDIRSAGIPAADAMKVLERSAQLGVAGLGTTAQAARLAAGAINAWGLEGEDADKIFNTIFQTTKNGITTIAGLEQGFGAVAGKMAEAGIEADDYFASIAALTTTTLKASGAHTQMRAAVDGLEKSGKKTRKVFRKLGVKDFKELVKTTGSVTVAFRKVKEVIGDQSGALKDLVGSSEGAAAITALVGAQGQKQIDTLAGMRKETEGLTDDQIAFNKQNKTSAAQWQKTKNQLAAAGISIGKILAPALSVLAKKLSAAVEWFDNLSDGTKENIVIVAGVVAAIGPAVFVLGKLTTAIGFASAAFGIMNRVMLANPFVAFLAVMTVVVLSIRSNWEDFEQFFELIWGGITGIFSDAWDGIKVIIDKIMAGIDRVKEAAGDIKAHFSAESTSGEIRAQKNKNQSISDDVFRRTGRPIPGFAPPTRTLTGEAAAELKKRSQAAASGQARRQAAERNEIVLKIEGTAEVKSKKGPSKIDVTTGLQGTI